jgi:hypothetical protein
VSFHGLVEREIEKHLIGDEREATALAQLQDGLPFLVSDVRAGGIVGVDDDDRLHFFSQFRCERRFHRGHINVPTRTMRILERIRQGVDLFERCEVLKQRIARLGNEHGVAGVA